MKKILSILVMISILLTFSLTACSQDNESNNSTNSSESSSNQNVTSSQSSNTQNSSSSQSSSSQNSSSEEQKPVTPELLYNDDEISKTFIVGSDIVFSNLIVKKLNSDNSMTDLAVTDYNIGLDKVNKDVAGSYDVDLSAGSLKKTFKINIVTKPSEVEGKVTIKMSTSYSGIQGATDINGFAQYSDLKCAIEMLASANYNDNVEKVLTFEAGEYISRFTIPATLKNVSFIGPTTDNAIISYNAYSSMKNAFGVDYSTDNSATVTVLGDKFTAKNITFKNSFDFIGNLNNKEMPNKQALAFYIRADKAVFENCKFYGYQDTLEVVAGRHYFYSCLIQGCTDFIFGNNSATLFENCEISSINNGKAFKESSNCGYITATKGNNGNNDEEIPQYGLVFLGCRLTTPNDATTGAPKTSVSLGRPWRKNSTVAWVNCEMGQHIGVIGGGAGGKPRYCDMEGGYDANNNKLNNSPNGARFFEYGNTGAGALTEVVYSKFYNYETKQVETHLNPDFNFLTETQYLTYTKANIFAKVNGGVTYADDWAEMLA